MRPSVLQFVYAGVPLLLVHHAFSQPAPTSQPESTQAVRTPGPQRDMLPPGAGIGPPGTQSNPAFLTDAELADWLETIARIHAVRATRRYELTPQQESAVRRRLEQLKEEAQAYWKRHRSELREIAIEMERLGPSWNPKTQDSSAIDRFRALRSRRGQIMQQQPLHYEAVFREIERLLPAEQVKAAAEREERTEKRLSDIARRAFTQGLPTSRAARGPTSRPGMSDLRRMEAAGGAVGEWKLYVQAFIQIYDLSEAQAATAWSVLRELQGQRDQYEASHREEYAAARNIEGREARHRRLTGLNEPIRDLFEELKARLNRIPTVAQRDAVTKTDAERLGTTTRPAEVGTRPASP